MQDEPIYYIGGDEEDQHQVTRALAEIGIPNKLVHFEDGPQLMDHMRTTHTKPFLILCDLRLPGMSGLELREEINNDRKLRSMSIPFIFLSESVPPRDVERAYLSLVQGFYQKPSDYDELKEQLQIICQYWARAIRP
ncbi:response regulator [Dyadobacter sandarakinus]|uniref:Response regulator n=1 Tax=Dyadobacter sandarakinus TaxID=2747268 RepID=A0ABX7I8K6_9BACT|nr:response regulator [Dyadobacter sandarakinus]QRR02446.1 response regulator [Dyadobacter sandarakinus]